MPGIEETLKEIPNQIDLFAHPATKGRDDLSGLHTGIQISNGDLILLKKDYSTGEGWERISKEVVEQYVNEQQAQQIGEVALQRAA